MKHLPLTNSGVGAASFRQTGRGHGEKGNFVASVESQGARGEDIEVRDTQCKNRRAPGVKDTGCTSTRRGGGGRIAGDR